jgi:hypothetical protein
MGDQIGSRRDRTIAADMTLNSIGANIRRAQLDAAGAANKLKVIAGQLRWLHSVQPALERALNSHTH